jgi:NADH-quinone oxidoreductase subunit A
LVDLAGIFITSVAALTAGLALQRLGLSGLPSEPQKTPYLGGSAPKVHAWQRYHVRYYSMTLLFIAFEMEMMFMYPWAVVFLEEGVKAMVEMGMFLAILSVGVLYGWREGIFRWQ